MIKDFCPDDLYGFRLCGRSVISPDGQKAIVPVQRIDKDQNKYFTNLLMIDCLTGNTIPFTYGDCCDTQPVWSPDSRQIVFMSDRGRESQLWRIRVDGGEARPLTTLTRGYITGPVWSPDGKWLAFLFQKRGHIGQAPPSSENEKTAAAANPQKETQPAQAEYEAFDKKEARRPKLIRKLSYKADGRGLLSEERLHIWLADTETGQTHQLTGGDYDDLCPVWAPDSSGLFFCSNRSEEAEYEPMRIDIWHVPVKGGKVRKIKTFAGPSIQPAVSSDGRYLAFVGHDNPDLFWASATDHLWLLDLSKRTLTNLTRELDRPLGNYISSDLAFLDADSGPQWAPDGQGLFFLASTEGACHLFYHDLKTNTNRMITQGPLDVRSFSLSGNGQRAVLTIADLSQPGDVFLYTFGKNIKRQRLTSLNDELLKERQVAKPEEIWLESDGVRYQCWFLKPHRFHSEQKYPLLLEIHGGPHILFGYNMFFEFQYLLARGYLVLYLNPRGSQGYGEEFTRSILKDWGGPDYRDIIQAVNTIAARPYVDRSRMGVTGGSYGGFMTNWIIGHTDMFSAAVSQRSVSSLTSLFGTSDAVHASQGVWGQYPWENRQLFDKLSPLSYVEHIHTPLLIIHSEYDQRCPIEQAEQLYLSLKHLRRTVEFVRFPQEGHELSRSGAPDHRLERLTMIADWFDRFLAKKQKKKTK